MIVDGIESIARKQKYADQNITFGGSTPPSFPQSGDMWFANPISTPYPQPWYWDSSNSIWLSAPFYLDFGYQTISSSNFIEKSIPFYGVTGNKILLRQVNSIVTNTTATAHTGSNYYQFAFKYTTGTGTPLPETVAYNLTTNTGNNPSALGGSASRRILEDANIFIPGNAWSLRYNTTKVGTPSNITIHTGLWVQYSRD